MSQLDTYIIENPNVKNTICAALWSHARVTVEGTVTPCCRYNHHKQSEQPKLKDGIGAALKSDFFEDVRRKMLNGEYVKECQQCYDEEKSGRRSMRTGLNDRYSSNILNEPKILFLETAFSSHCNLACRMCNETASSKWKLIKNPGTKVDVELDGNDVVYYDDTDLSELELVKMVGGEPLLDKNHHINLDKFISQSKNPENIKLTYHTNGTVFPNKNILDYWRQVHTVNLVFSIDAYGELNDYLRPGSSWETLTNNILKLKELKDINFKFNTHSVVSNISIWKLHKLIEWKKETFNGDIGGYFVLDGPMHMSIKNMSSEIKEKIKAYLVDHNIESYSWLYKMININLEKPPEIEPLNFSDIQKYMKQLDAYFGQNFWENINDT